MSIGQGVDRAGRTIDRATLRLSATLLLAGQLLYILVTQFHAGGDANNHPAIFVSYARSGDWKAVHVGQFLTIAVIVAGLVLLYYAVDPRAGAAAAAARVGVVLAGVALGLYAVLQAVDGVGNSQVDAAWANAPAADKPARFASAEAMRWLEWGVRSYHDYALGLDPHSARTRGRGQAARRGAPRDCLADVPVGSCLPGTRLGCRRTGLLQRQHHLDPGGLGAQPGMDDLAGHRHSAQAAGRGA